jgi:hypothetical protein
VWGEGRLRSAPSNELPWHTHTEAAGDSSRSSTARHAPRRACPGKEGRDGCGCCEVLHKDGGGGGPGGGPVAQEHPSTAAAATAPQRRSGQKGPTLTMPYSRQESSPHLEIVVLHGLEALPHDQEVMRGNEGVEPLEVRLSAGDAHGNAHDGSVIVASVVLAAAAVVVMLILCYIR